jgi:hypothetical protein
MSGAVSARQTLGAIGMYRETRGARNDAYNDEFDMRRCLTLTVVCQPPGPTAVARKRVPYLQGFGTEVAQEETSERSTRGQGVGGAYFWDNSMAYHMRQGGWLRGPL